MLKIGILQADSVLPQFQPAHGNYPGMIRDVLGRAAARLDLEVSFETWDVEHGEYPGTPTDCDGYVITGSRKSVYDDEPWIHRLIDYVRELHRSYADRVKLVGICFGHQLVAEALGGKTLPAESGWGVGVQQATVLRRAWFMDDADGYNLVVSHKDQVARLPEQAELLASSDYCPNSMFMIGDHILTLQGHPEFTADYSADLMEMRREILGESTYRAGVSSLAKPVMRDDVARWIIRFLEGRPST